MNLQAILELKTMTDSDLENDLDIPTDLVLVPEESAKNVKMIV